MSKEKPEQKCWIQEKNIKITFNVDWNHLSLSQEYKKLGGAALTEKISEAMTEIKKVLNPALHYFVRSSYQLCGAFDHQKTIELDLDFAWCDNYKRAVGFIKAQKSHGDTDIDSELVAYPKILPKNTPKAPVIIELKGGFPYVRG